MCYRPSPLVLHLRQDFNQCVQLPARRHRRVYALHVRHDASRLHLVEGSQRLINSTRRESQKGFTRVLQIQQGGHRHGKIESTGAAVRRLVVERHPRQSLC